ncbi:MAG: hypothetical protein ACFFDB_00775 [Promethearchaeota archaeon]
MCGKVQELISDGLKVIKKFLKLNSWKDDYTEERTVELSKSERDLIERWLVDILPVLDDWQNIILSGKKYALSDSGEETLNSIIKRLHSKKQLIFTEYELGFMIYWLNQVRKGLDGDFSNAEFILLLQIFEKFKNQLKESEMKETIEKIIEKIRC